MINVTDTIKKAYEESTTQYDKIVLDGQEYYINNAQYEDDCYYEGNIFGTAIARTLEFEIEDSIDLEKKEFEYLTGVKTENGIEWINLGNFITQDLEPNDTTGINKVTAMDYMLKSNIEYTTELNYESGEVTILQVLQEACQEAGLTLATTDFANASFIVDSNQFDEGILIRQVFQAVAQISGTFAKIRNDNKLYFITPKYSGLKVKDIHKMKVKDLNSIPVNKLIGCKNEFKMNDYSELILKRNTHPINLVSLGMSDVEGENVIKRDEESIEKDGENSLIINDNPFAYTEEKRHQLISALFDTVKGFEYTAYEITGQAKPYQETGDEVVVIDKDGTFTHSFLFRFNFKSPNGLESEMSAPSITKATIEYQNIESAEQIAKKTELRVDKQEQTITGIITQQTETSEKLTEVKQTIDGITQKVSSVEEKVETVEDKADNAQTSADNANNKIDNLSVGARNLLLSTQTQNTEKGNTITGAVKTGEKFLNCDVFRSSNAWASIGFNLKRVIEDNNLKVGDKLTYSIYNKTDDTVARDIALYTSPYSTEGTGSRELKLFKDTLNTEWTRLVVTFEITETMMNCKETNNLRTRYECKTACTTGKYQYWCAPKLELGTIATDWTPAPEDVEDNLTTNYYTKTETNSQIDQKANQITQTVSETYSTKTETTNAKQEAIDSANASTDEKLEDYSTTTEMNSAITQKANEITQQVDTKYDYLRDAVQTNEIKLQDTVAGQGYVTEFKIKGNTSNFKYLAPSDTLVPSNTLVPLGDHFTIICDKQSRSSMSNEAVQVDVKLSEPLRNVGEIYDELNIIDGKTTVTRRIGVNSDLSLYVLSTEVTEALQDVKLSTFDRDTYIYIKEYTGIAYMAKYIIKNDYSDKFITKMEANSKIEEKADSIELDVNKKLENYSTTTEMEATIKLETDKITESVSNKYATKDELSEEKSERIQTANEITQTVSTKVGNNEIISKINQSAEAVGIDADKIELSANDVLNLLAGNTINLSGKNIKITSNNFNVDENGNMECANANISGGKINLETSRALGDRIFTIKDDAGATSYVGTINASIGYSGSDIFSGVYIQGRAGGQSSVRADVFTQTSLEELKKNIEKLEEGLEIVKNTDIYKYNLKSEKDTDKKHIGFVIGKDYKYSKEITAVNKEGKETGAEIYSMVAVLYKAMQEVAERLEKLEEVQNEKDNI